MTEQIISADGNIHIYHTDCLEWMENFRLGTVAGIKLGCIDFIFTDPPFGTGSNQLLRPGGPEYSDKITGNRYWEWLRQLILDCYHVLSATGSMMLLLDYRAIHRAKLIMDNVFGEQCFRNEIIWAYDWGFRQKNPRQYASKHFTILWYSKDPEKWIFDSDAMMKESYRAPELKKACMQKQGKTENEIKSVLQDGKPVTDVWFKSIGPATAPGGRFWWPNQKAYPVLRSIVATHTTIGDVVLDPCAGSGVLGMAAADIGRKCILLDKDIKAIEAMREHLVRR